MKIKILVVMLLVSVIIKILVVMLLVSVIINSYIAIINDNVKTKNGMAETLPNTCGVCYFD